MGLQAVHLPKILNTTRPGLKELFLIHGALQCEAAMQGGNHVQVLNSWRNVAKCGEIDGKHVPEGILSLSPAFQLPLKGATNGFQ